MTMKVKSLRLRLAVSAAMLGVPLAAAAVPAAAQQNVAPRDTVTLSVGSGRLVQLDGTMQDLFVANEGVADVQVRSNSSIFIFGKAAGQTTVYATDAGGRIVYSATIRVGQNLASVDDMLQLAMPEAQIHANTINGLVLLTGTVAQPSDAEEAQRLVQAFVGEGTQVVSRLRTATPQQVMLKVTVAEVSRSLVRDVAANVQSADSTNGFQFGISRGRGFAPQYTPGGPLGVGVTQGSDGTSVITNTVGSVLGGAGRLFGVDLLGALDANEDNGLVNILAEPTLTALSGETASFLAGGEFPIPIAQQLGAVSIEYKQYGVSLAFSPIVLENGRISMRVRPEVSEISTQGSVRLNGYDVPALTTRRTETTVELGSGQSMMISGLLRNTSANTINRTPFLGRLPILGALFRSNGFRRQETELVIVITPYLVQPVSANRIALPTDGFRAANDGQQLLLGQSHAGRTEARPTPSAGEPRAVGSGPGVSGTPVTAVPVSAQPVASAPASGTARPGFDF